MNDTDMVQVETLQEGVVVDHRPRRRGERVAVDRATREQLGGLVRERPLLRIRAKISCVVGTHCYVAGEERDVAPEFELVALERYKADHISVLNAAELGITLPPRHSERAARAGLVKVKVLKPFQPDGIYRPAVQEGWILEVPPGRADEWAAEGLVERVEDAPPAPAPPPKGRRA
jgi:hypothetical protein